MPINLARLAGFPRQLPLSSNRDLTLWRFRMALMLGSLYDALKSAGVDDEKAKRAADEVAGYDNRVGNVEADLTLLKWMAGTNIALTIAVLFKVFS